MTIINAAHLIKAINLYPGSGEYVYEVNPVISGEEALNIHNDQGKADARLSLEHLKQTMPNLKYISVMINWFATDTNAGIARIIPKIETADKQAEWEVAGYNRQTAEEMHYYPNGEITFGGTPTDRSIVELCSYLKEQGYKVMISPILMIDDESLSKPWRGYITPKGRSTTRQKDIEHFFKNEHGYNKFIMHYATLEHNGIKLKDVIDSFAIGGELKGLTSIKVNEYLYPAITQLKSLAGAVREAAGLDVKITYSANWGDEYHNANLDNLWCDPNIDWVGISAYFPITDELPQEQITYSAVKNGWTSGEGIDYYKDGNTKIPYNNQDWAWKNVEHWWSSYHLKGSTCWVPKMKPVIFTEYGFPSTDGAANKPNFYFDPASGDSINTNNQSQSDAIAASEMYFAEANARNSNFLPLTFLYVWDARTYPYFPSNCHYWSDCQKHQYSHAVNGKLLNVDIPQEDLQMAGNFTHDEL